MKTIILSLACMMFISANLKAEEGFSSGLSGTEVNTNLDQDSSLMALDDTGDFDIMSPPGDRGRGDRGRGGWDRGRGDRGRGGWDRGRGDRGRGDRGRNYGSWTCIAHDNGYEEHWGGHAGYGRSQFEAAENATYICRMAHGGCYVSNCSSGY